MVRFCLINDVQKKVCEKEVSNWLQKSASVECVAAADARNASRVLSDPGGVNERHATGR